MGWKCSSDEGDMNCIQNFGGEASWKAVTWGSEKEMTGR